ncbi:MAG: ABC transporter ATP-binding protein [Planctomycetota bacterium]
MPLAIHLAAVTKVYRVPHRRPFLARALLRGVLPRPAGEAPAAALREIDLAVERGESVGIVGANGSGKTTLLSLVAGTMHPTRGTVRVEGRVGPLLELGAGFHPDLTGYENLQLNAALLGLTRAEIRARLASIVDFAEIDEHLHAPVRTYSTGMIARAGFAVLAHVDPEILLVDEVLAVGDARFRAKCERTMEGFRARGITQLLVSHNLPLLERLCGRTIWLDGGRIRADGPPAAVLARYREEQGAAGESRIRPDRCPPPLA